MAKSRQNAISPTRNEDFPEWYQQVVKASDMAESSPVRGCMVIKPWGYAVWENMRSCLDRMFKETGHVNAYFPLFIPLSFLEKEAEHVEGFAKECAVVTHHRLEKGPDGTLRPVGQLAEPLVVRPTSETIIGASYAKWVQSYRDLPILINQWANVVRWEMRPRVFLRTTEFLWQEGHTVHETREQAWEETLKMLEVYRTFAEQYMAVPVITGSKTPGERFPGAEETFCIEAMMQDRKALQAGTSHFLGRNFAKASGIEYQTRDGGREYAWTTSWGVSTRLIGCMIMVHSDDDGLALPPMIAPSHVAVLPIIQKEENRPAVMEYAGKLAERLQSISYNGAKLGVELDTRDMNAGEKNWHWIKKGIPVRVEIGPRDIAGDSVFVGRRDRPPNEKKSIRTSEFAGGITDMLNDIQKNLLDRARAIMAEHTRQIDDWDEFVSFFTPADREKPEIHGGFAESHWCGAAECENRVNADLSVTIRCVPADREQSDAGKCIACGGESKRRVVFAKSY